MDPTFYVSSGAFQAIIYGSIGLLGCTVALLLVMFIKEIKNKTLW